MSAPAVLAAAWVATAAAAVSGGHEPPARAVRPAEAEAEDRKATLQEMWRRRILAPDQNAWAPADMAMLDAIRRVEPDAFEYLKSKFLLAKPFVASFRSGGQTRQWLTKEGHQRYLGGVTQDAIVYFEGKGADAKQVFKLTDWEGRRLFTPEGVITEEGAKVYRRAVLKLEVYWKAPDGRAFGTRRPPAPGSAPAK